MTVLADEQAALLSEFLVETTEHLDLAEERLLQLEESPDNPTALRELMRVFHTIKGNGGYFGFREMTDLAHRLEALLTSVQDGTEGVSEAMMAELLSGVDRLRALVRQAGAAGEEASGRAGDAPPEAGESPAPEEAEQGSRHLVFEVGELQMALPVSQVVEVMRPVPIARLPHVDQHVAGVVNLRGLIVPLVDLEQRLWGTSGLTQAQHLVVVPYGRGRLALAVRRVVAVTTLNAGAAQCVETDRFGVQNIVMQDGSPLALLDLGKVLGSGATT